MALARCPFLLRSLWSGSMSPSLQGQISTLLLGQPVPAGKTKCPSNHLSCGWLHPSFHARQTVFSVPQSWFCSHLPMLMTFREQGPGQIPTTGASSVGSTFPTVPQSLGLGLTSRGLGASCHWSQVPPEALRWLGTDTGQAAPRFGISGAVFQLLLCPLACTSDSVLTTESNQFISL